MDKETKQEKIFSMENAFQVWWFIFWRTLLTTFIIFFILNVVSKFIGNDLEGLINTIALIFFILVQVFYTKKAVNRNYKGFRLSSNLLENDRQK